VLAGLLRLCLPRWRPAHRQRYESELSAGRRSPPNPDAPSM
jgi:hypothetical protein